MPIPVTCPGCMATVLAPDEEAGKMGTCADCGASLWVPTDAVDLAGLPSKARLSLFDLKTRTGKIVAACAVFFALACLAAALEDRTLDPSDRAAISARHFVTGRLSGSPDIARDSCTVLDLADGSKRVTGAVTHTIGGYRVTEPFVAEVVYDASKQTTFERFIKVGGVVLFDAR